MGITHHGVARRNCPRRNLARTPQGRLVASNTWARYSGHDGLIVLDEVRVEGRGTSNGCTGQSKGTDCEWEGDI